MSPKPIVFSDILTDDLYSQVLRIQFPWDGGVNLKTAFSFYFRGDPGMFKRCFEAFHFRALKPISSACPTIPNVRQYLPERKDRVYAEHTLALIILLDQMPRYSYTGVDTRYTYNFFGETGKQLVKELIQDGALPDSTEEWMTMLGPGFSFEDAMIRKYWLYVPLIHSEHLEDHELASGFIESIRKEVEVYYGQRDPWRDRKEVDSGDVTLFSRIATGGPPLEGTGTNAELWFWMFRMFDAHKPILEKFGRYPYRNETLGREDTESEKEFLKATENFGMRGLSDEETEKLREQVKNGVWGELSDKGFQGFME